MSQEIRTISSIKAARIALGWSQPDLAARSGVSLVAIARLEAGMVSPRLSTLSKLKEALTAAGVRIVDNEPPGGYTLSVNAQAIAESVRRNAQVESSAIPGVELGRSKPGR